MTSTCVHLVLFALSVNCHFGQIESLCLNSTQLKGVFGAVQTRLKDFDFGGH